jgi:predicted DNA-binding transcriptional regulator AlpA
VAYISKIDTNNSKMENAMTKILSKRDVSEAYGWPIATLNDWRHTGKGPRSFMIGGRVAYKLEDIERWIEEQYRADDTAVQRVG